MIDTPTYGSLLSRSGFKFCVTDKLHFEIEYQDPWDLIIDLKSIGETNCLIKRSKRTLTKIFLKDVINFYKNNFSSSKIHNLSLIHISEPTRPLYISYAVFCLKKKKKNQ